MSAQPAVEPPAAPTAVWPVGLPSSGDVAGWVRAAGEMVAGLRACLDGADVTVTAGDIQAIERVARRLDAARLAALARVDASGLAGHSGAASTGAWYARATRSTAADAASQVNLAKSLDDGLDRTSDAMAEGSLSTEHARVIARAIEDLPDDVTPAERDRIERHLVEQARLLDPARLRRAARRALEAIARPAEEVDAHHGATLREEEDRARARTRLTLRDNHDGTTSGSFTIPTFAASALRKIIQQMTAPRRQQQNAAWGAPGAAGTQGAPRAGGPSHATATRDAAADTAARDDAGAGQAFFRDAADEPAPTCRPPSDYTTDGQVDGKAMATDWAHAFGLAFVSLLERLPTDHLSHKVAATVVVTLDHDKLVSGLGAAGVDTGTEISAAEARRLACTAGIIPAVLGTTSVPLDLGRTTRLFSEAQRVALAGLYDSCAVDGCDRPFSWCEIHHTRPWADGGPTNLGNAVPVCSFHHHRLDDPNYSHTISTDARGTKTIRLYRRT